MKGVNMKIVMDSITEIDLSHLPTFGEIMDGDEKEKMMNVENEAAAYKTMKPSMK